MLPFSAFLCEPVSNVAEVSRRPENGQEGWEERQRINARQRDGGEDEGRELDEEGVGSKEHEKDRTQGRESSTQNTDSHFTNHEYDALLPFGRMAAGVGL